MFYIKLYDEKKDKTEQIATAEKAVKEVLSIHPQRLEMLIDDLEKNGYLDLNYMKQTEKDIVLDCLKLAKTIKQADSITLKF